MALEVLQQNLFFHLGGDRSSRGRDEGLNVDLPSTPIGSDMEKLRVRIPKADPGETRALAQFDLLDGEETQVGALKLVSQGTFLVGEGPSLLRLVHTEDDLFRSSKLHSEVADALPLPPLKGLCRTSKLDVDAADGVVGQDILAPGFGDSLF
ncbi:hypothetical protein ACQ4PT_044377 [Festuca glaucescens]